MADKTPNERDVAKLREDARYTYLDGKTARAKKLNKEADALEKKLRAASNKCGLSFNEVHRTLNERCREGQVSSKHLIDIVRDIMAIPATCKADAT